MIQQSVRSALNPTGGFLSGFSHTLNPYAGCAFGVGRGCPFCYVRTLPVARKHPGAWGEWVIVKENFPEVLARELEKLDCLGKLNQAAIFMSSATDPYQGVERRFEITRRSLQAISLRMPRRLLLQTRSPMVERDVEVLRKLGSRVIVSLTLETDREDVRRSLTPTSPSVARRLRTAHSLRAAGIFVQLAISPMMPNDPSNFAELADSAADRVVIDTYLDGDGSGGRRSRELGMPQLYESLGYSGWFERGAETALVEAMRRRLGEERVLFSRQGFNAV